MAVEPATNQAPEDYQAHFRDYSWFTWLFKVTAVVVFVIALFVILIIS